MSRRVAICAALLWSAVAVAEDGRFCADGACRDVARGRVTVTSTDTPRSFVWTSTSGKEVILGQLAAGAESVDLTERPSLRFQVTSSDDRQWPLPMRIAIDGHEWSVPAGDSIAAVRVIGLDAGAHALRIHATHHEAAERNITISERTADAGRIVLKRWPILAGRVVRARGGDGVTGAIVALPTQVVLTTVDDPSGDFEAEITGEWPDSIRVSYPGFGTRVVTVPRIAADADLGLIALSSGATLSVTLDYPDRASRVTGELTLVDGEQPTVASQIIAPDENTLTFRDLAPATYRLLLRGEGPFERHTKEWTLKEAETREDTVAIRPVDIAIAVAQRRGPVSGAVLQIDNVAADWRAEVSTNEEGRYSGKLWQHGYFMAMITVDPHPTTSASAEFLSGDVSWPITLSDQRITGVVVDAVQGRPVPGASLFVSTEEEDSSSLLRLKANEAGVFSVEFSRPGRHTITARADGFMSATTSFTTTKDDTERSVRLALARGTERVVRVRSASGAPIAGALVVDEQGMMGANAFTDAQGVVRMTVPQRQTKSFYVLPKEGSFAIVQVDDRSESEVAVTVAPGDASIVVRTQDETLTSVPNVSVMMRFNGHFLPMPVTVAMMQQQGRSFTTASYGKLVLEHMPAGLYDLWPYFSQAEARAMKIGPDAPARIAAQPGPNAVTLTFARASRTGAP